MYDSKSMETLRESFPALPYACIQESLTQIIHKQDPECQVNKLLVKYSQDSWESKASGTHVQKGRSAPEAVQSGQIESCSVRPRHEHIEGGKGQSMRKGTITDTVPYLRDGFLHVLA